MDESSVIDTHACSIQMLNGMRPEQSAALDLLVQLETSACFRLLETLHASVNACIYFMHPRPLHLGLLLHGAHPLLIGRHSCSTLKVLKAMPTAGSGFHIFRGTPGALQAYSAAMTHTDLMKRGLEWWTELPSFKCRPS